MIKYFFAASLMVLVALSVEAQNDTTMRRTLDEVSIQQRKTEGVSRLGGAVNGLQLGQDELFRAACCNLGESFITNPSVDVNYNDAAVGAKQIKLLGLSGQYVQMLLENLPVALGAAMPYQLGYVPGAWMKSISVSKGASSVKNGPQSITGQINVEYLKPEDEPALQVNVYGDSRLKGEANVMGNFHLNHNLSTEVLTHYEKDFMHMDEDGDGWHDSPALEQLHLQNRWYYAKGRYIMHAGFGYLHENREGGQMKDFAPNPYRVMIEANRLDAYMKHAFLLDRKHNTNLALLATGSLYNLDGTFGLKEYSDRQHSLNTQLVLEHDFNDIHNLSTGLSFNADRMNEKLLIGTIESLSNPAEYTPGAYAQYTFKPSYKLTAMAGLRVDYSSLYGRSYLTPRLHVKWVPADWMTLRASSGKGYRTPYALAEHHYLLTSGRTLVVGDLKQEESWNSGLSLSFYVPVMDRTLTLNAEYYYTDFINQAVVDFDSDPTAITIDNLNGTSYSHTLQVDANYDLTEDLNLLAAFRYNRVMCTYGGQLMEKPLHSRYKGLITLSWKPMLALWQVDFTLQLNGGGRIPDYLDENGALVSGEEFPAYLQLNLQLTREFRRFSLYVGGENLTNYRQENPVINAANPWSSTFDPTLVWGPVHGIMAYAGIRLNFPLPEHKDEHK
ncbi:MAG: TonB-dependent receptor [Bacteroidales bacterium]|nr:TonB-dependent receptor [Bacteroidales bacterium]